MTLGKTEKCQLVKEGIYCSILTLYLYIITAVIVERIGKAIIDICMGKYVNSHLTREEIVLFEAHYHWCVSTLPIFALVVLSVFSCTIYISDLDTPITFPSGLLILLPALLVSSITSFLLCLPLFIYIHFKKKLDEFAITNQRLIIKKGIISRSTLELNLSKVETIVVSQSIFGRIFNFGHIEIKGTGSTIFTLKYIDKPYDFRKAFQDVLVKHIASNVNDVCNNSPETTINNNSSTEPSNIKSNNGESGIIGKTESLKRIKELLDSGILTQEEFDSEKKKILNS